MTSNHCMRVTCVQAGKLELVSEGRDNPLHAAVRAGRGELIEVLLAAGARIDIRDDRCGEDFLLADNKKDLQLVSPFIPYLFLRDADP